MLVRSSHSITFPIPSIPIHSLESIVLPQRRTRRKRRLQSTRELRHPHSSLRHTWRHIPPLREHLRLPKELLLLADVGQTRSHRARGIVLSARRGLAYLLRVFLLIKVLCNLNLDIAQVPLARNPLPLLLVRVGGFLSPRWATFEAAVPVVGHEAFALVALRGAVRVDVVDVGKVGLEPARAWLALLDALDMLERDVLFFVQSDVVVHGKQLLPPCLKIWWVCDQLQPLELAMFRQRSVVGFDDWARSLSLSLNSPM
jgi:hypothetical protein